MSRNVFVCLCCVALLAACSGAPAATPTPRFVAPAANRTDMHQDADHDGAVHTDAGAVPAGAGMGVALVPSELVVGPNRFAVGLFDPAGQVVSEAEVRFDYYDLRDPQAPILESRATATPVRTPDGLVTVFMHERDFAHAGAWGAEVQARFPDGGSARKRIAFTVLADSPTLRPGARARVVDTPTAADVGHDVGRLTSAPEPNPAFYALSLPEALANGKPTVLLLATPAFCQTRFCGPAYELTSEIQHRYGEAVNFVHVEVYTGLPNPAANNWELAPVMTAFGLTTEPWLYLIAANGIVVYRAESIFTVDEVAHHLQPLLN